MKARERLSVVVLVMLDVLLLDVAANRTLDIKQSICQMNSSQSIFEPMLDNAWHCCRYYPMTPLLMRSSAERAPTQIKPRLVHSYFISYCKRFIRPNMSNSTQQRFLLHLLFREQKNF